MMDATNRDRYLSRGWNNAISAGLGLPASAFAAVAVFASALSDRSAFIWLVIIGVVY